MDQHRIVAGFSDIKNEFIGRCRIEKDSKKLKLWFTFQNEVFWVHDFHNHKVKMVLAVENVREHNWKVLLPEGRYGELLVRYIIATAPTLSLTISERAKELYQSHGFFPYI